MHKYKVYLPGIREYKIVNLNDIGPLAAEHPGLIIQEKVWVEEVSNEALFESAAFDTDFLGALPRYYAPDVIGSGVVMDFKEEEYEIKDGPLFSGVDFLGNLYDN